MVHSVHHNLVFYNFNPLNAELNPICHLLALLGAHHILHVSRIRVNQKLNTLVILFTVIFSKTLNFQVFRTLLVDHNGGYCELNDSCVYFILKIVEYVCWSFDFRMNF